MDYFDYCAGLTMTNSKFDAIFGGPPRKPEARLTQREMDLAASIQQVTEVPEKFFGYYPGARAIGLADPGIPSPFMEMHDRPPRDASKCERNETVSLTQSLHWIAGQTLNQRLHAEQSVLRKKIREGRSNREIVDERFVSAVSRAPSSARWSHG
jgi:hypothetical protein